MPLTEQPRTESLPGSTPPGPIHLRLRGGTGDEQIIALATGKHSIGSGPRCTVRLREPGVRPLHCLIVHDAEGVRVRRWADDTLLNGRAFDEALFGSGDRLSIGPVVVEIVAPPSDNEAGPSAASRADTYEVEDIGQREMDLPLPANGDAFLGAPRETSTDLTAPTQDTAPALSRSRARKLLGATRRNRDACRELAVRLATAEEMFRQAAEDRGRTGGVAAEAIAQISELADQLNTSRDRIANHDLRLNEHETLWKRCDIIAATTVRLADECHQLGGEQARISSEIAQLASEHQAFSNKQVALTSLLESSRDLSDDSDRGQTDFDQLFASNRIELESCNGRLDEQTSRLEIVETNLADTGQGFSLIRDHGLKLLAIVRRNRHAGREMGKWLAKLEEQVKAVANEQMRRPNESVQEADASQEDQAAAWRAVIEATDRLGDKCQRLAEDNARLEAEMQQFVAVPEGLVTENAANSRKLTELQERIEENSSQLREEQQLGLAQVEQLKAELQQRKQKWESTISDRAQSAEDWQSRLDECLRRLELGESRTAPHEALLEQSRSQHADCEERLQEADSRSANGDDRIAALETQLQDVCQRLESAQAQLEEQGQQQISSTAAQDAPWEQLTDLQSQLAAYCQRLDDLERQLEHDEHAEEKAAWQQQMAGLHPMLAEYSAQVSDLREQIDLICRAREAGALTAEEPPLSADPPALGAAVSDDVGSTADSGDSEGGSGFQPTSFIDRYAHTFADDTGDPPMLEPSATGGKQSFVSSAEPDVALRPAAEPPPLAGDDDESIEQYMSKMMQRLHGDSPAAFSPASASATTASAPPSDRSADEPPGPIDEPQRKIGPAPKLDADIQALRALANQTTRHAIGVHTAGKLRRKALTWFIIALLAGTMGVFFMVRAPNWHSIQFGMACAALVASMYWGWLTFASLIRAARVGAFDEYEPELAAVESAEQHLPIDVDH